MERRKFTREFKLEAARLIRDRGVSYMQAARDLSVHQSQLRNWVKAFADDPLLESRQRLGREDRRRRFVVDTLVIERLGTALVVYRSINCTIRLASF
jgi:transposase-like protein